MPMKSDDMVAKTSTANRLSVGAIIAAHAMTLTLMEGESTQAGTSSEDVLSRE